MGSSVGNPGPKASVGRAGASEPIDDGIGITGNPGPKASVGRAGASELIDDGIGITGNPGPKASVGRAGASELSDDGMTGYPAEVEQGVGEDVGARCGGK
jgi:hypothetical protein